MTTQQTPEARFFTTLDNAVLHAENNDRQKAYDALELARGMDYVASDLNRAHWDLCAAKLATTFNRASGWYLSTRALEEFQGLGLTTEMEQCALLLELNHYARIKLETPEKTFQLLKDLHEIRKTLKLDIDFVFDSGTEMNVFCTQTKEQMTAFFNTDAVRKLLPSDFVLEDRNTNQINWHETSCGVSINSQGSRVSISRINDGSGYFYQSGVFWLKNQTLAIDVLEPCTQKPVTLEFVNVPSDDVQAIMDCLNKK